MAFIFLILSAVLIHLSPSVTADINVLLTGETLYTDQQLYYKGSTFAMQRDCNLVLYDQKGQSAFESKTKGKGVNCTLSMTANGRFIVQRANGSTVWITPNFYSKIGNYAAVLGPKGEVAIYGPQVWSTPAAVQEQPPRALGDKPVVHNLLFSGEYLSADGKLTSRDFSFILKSDCKLYVEKAAYGVVWKSPTRGCLLGSFNTLQLDRHGQISIVNLAGGTVWATEPTSKDGDYVLVLQTNGQAAIYGPKVWSTAASPVNDGKITSVAVE